MKHGLPVEYIDVQQNSVECALVCQLCLCIKSASNASFMYTLTFVILEPYETEKKS